MVKFLTEFSNFNRYKIKFLKLTSVLALILQIYYLFRYIFEHKQIFYAQIFAPFVLITALSCFLVNFKNRYELGSKLLSFSCFIPLAILIGTVGGFKAPGLQWLSLVPVLFGLFFGRKGIIIGVLSLIVTAGIYYSFPMPNFITSQTHYEKEKIVNFVLYSIFLLVLFFGYIKIMESFEKDLGEKNEQIKNLLRVVIHDLSNPTQILKLIIERNKELFEPKVYKNADRSLESIISIINDVRQLQSFTDNKFSLKKEAVKVSSLIEDIEILFRSKLLEKNIRLKTKYNISTNSEVIIDSSIFKNQILNNFISNAIKFSPRDSEIKIKTYQQSGKIVLEIIDSGPGIDLEKVEKLFNNENQTTTLGTLGEKGTGYGLPIAGFFLKKLNVQLNILTNKNSELEKGTCFQMVFN